MPIRCLPYRRRGFAGPEERKSKVKNQIGRDRKLVVPSPIVIGLRVPGTFETQLGPQLNRAANPMAPHDGVLRVAGRVTGALTFFVIQEIATKRNKVVRR